MTSARPLVWDTETVPLLSSLSAVYPREEESPPSNYGAEAAEKWHLKNAEKWMRRHIKASSLDPRFGRILALGSTHEKRPMLYAPTEADEPTVIAEFWEHLADHGGRMVTFNGVGFDVPFFLKRSMRHRIKPTVDSATIREWLRKYVYHTHCDLMGLLLNWRQPEKGDGLAGWTEHFGLTANPDGTDGSDVAFLFENEEHDRIKAKCHHDVASTAGIYDIIHPYYIGGAA